MKLLSSNTIKLCGIIIAFMANPAVAQGKFVDISINGSYSKSHAVFSTTTRTSYGLELGLPISSFFEVALGHTVTKDTETFNSIYLRLLRAKGIDLPEYHRKSSITDSSVNGSMGVVVGPLKPTVFAGVLWRKECGSDSLAVSPCQSAAGPTWNAGIGVSVLVTYALRLKITYRISPSYDYERNRKAYDELISLGLSWGI